MNNATIGCGAPFDYNEINLVAASAAPTQLHTADSKLSRFFRRYLLQKAISRFEWSIPKNWDKDYFLYCLYCWGFVAVINTNKYGVIPQGCSLAGYNVFYRPTNAIITNPLLGGIREPIIGEQCTLIKLQPDYGGIMDMVSYYADMMALSAQTAQTNILNSKLSYVFTAGNKAAAESLKKLYDEIASGLPAVVQDKNLLLEDGRPAWQSFTQNLRENYIAGDLLEDMRKWELDFDTKIGINNANTDKKERLIVDEVNANNEEVKSMAALWLENLQKSLEDTRAMFGIPESVLSVKWRTMPEEVAPDMPVEGGAEDDLE